MCAIQVIVVNPAFFKYTHDKWTELHGRYPSTGIVAITFALHLCDEVCTCIYSQDNNFCITRLFSLTVFNPNRCQCLDMGQISKETGTTTGSTTDTPALFERRASTMQISRLRSFKGSTKRAKSNCTVEPVIVAFTDSVLLKPGRAAAVCKPKRRRSVIHPTLIDHCELHWTKPTDIKL